MTSVHYAALNRSIEVDRIIAHIQGHLKGPTVIFFGGMHGNENSGVMALYQVAQELKDKENQIRGNIFALAGNLKALGEGKRYCKEDLNRLWDSDQIEKLNNGQLRDPQDEALEQKDIYQTLQKIMSDYPGPFYFMDLHTTSSQSVPFVVVNDSLLNRKFASQFPVPMILGIEEYLDGAILSYINELGYVSFGFEAGQHDSLASYENQMAFIYLALTFSESIAQSAFDYYHYYQQLSRSSILSRNIYEISYRFKVTKEDQFRMLPGYVNFQRVRKGQLMAHINGREVIASHTGRVFMPLYQSQGRDGFFEIRMVRPIFLKLSAILRKTRLAHILPYLPGIRWQSEKKEALVVNLRIARFFTRQFMHLLGYRSRKIDKTHLIIKNRESASRTTEYNAQWNE